MNPLCPACGVPTVCYCTKIVGQSRVRYLTCPQCGAKPTPPVRVIPLAYAPRRVKTCLPAISKRAVTD